MGYERHVKLFKNGRSQAVRIPREFELPGTEAIMRKEGGRIMIEAVQPQSFIEYLRTFPPSEEDIGPIDDPLPEPFEL